MRFIWIFAAVIALYCCSQNSINSIPDSQSSVLVFEQIPGCLEGNPAKTAARDAACFQYDFQQNLKLELCLPANCCPDSARFDYNCTVGSDTIYFTVQDTAQELCDCMCTYKIQTEISGLQRDVYIFKCFYKGLTAYDTLVYRSIDQ